MLTSSSLESSSSPEVRAAWMSSMASVFEISPFLNCLTTAMTAWTAAVANPAEMV